MVQAGWVFSVPHGLLDFNHTLGTSAGIARWPRSLDLSFSTWLLPLVRVVWANKVVGAFQESKTEAASLIRSQPRTCMCHFHCASLMNTSHGAGPDFRAGEVGSIS